MAINYTNLFTVLGKYIKTVDDHHALLSTIETLKGEIGTELENASLIRLFDSIPSTFDGFKSDVSGWISSIISQATVVLTDRDFVVEELPIINSDIESVLKGLIEDMVSQDEDVLESTVTIGSVTDNISDATSGDLLVDSTLDGITSPYPNAPAVKEYLGLTSQLAVDSDTVYCECISDASGDGNETWKLFSKGSATSPYQIQEESAGEGPTLNTANSSAGLITVSNGNMETFTVADTPNNWTMTGTVTTDYSENNASSYIFRNTSSLAISTSGTSLKQQLNNVTKSKMYLTSLQVARPDTDVGTMDVVISIENSDGSTVYKTNTTTVSVPSSSSDLFIPVKLYWWVDDSVDTNDVYLKITVNNFVSSPTLDLYIDEVLTTCPVYYNGVNFTVLRGKTKYIVGDRFSVNISNDNAGTIQTFFRRAYDVQLRTISSGPSINDSLAT